MSAPQKDDRRSRTLFPCFWLAIWLAQVLPARVIADDALDPSWSQSLGRFLAQGLKAGVDYVFTYGPLGYFSTDVYEPALFWHKLFLWEFAWRLVASWFLARALWDNCPRFGRIAALVLLLALPLSFDAFAFAVIVAVASVLDGERRGGIVVRPLGFLLLASLALVKFTFTVGAGATASALIVGTLSSAGRRAALRDAAWALGGLAVFWFATRQSFANFWPWLHNSLLIASGYNEGESRPASVFSLCIGLLTLACVLFVIAQSSKTPPRTPVHSSRVTALARPLRASRLARVALGAALALDCFLSFKAGYVRGDDHTTYYLGFALCACWLVPFAPTASARASFLRDSAAVLALSLAAWGILVAPEDESRAPITRLADYAARLPNNARDMFLPWRAHAELESARDANSTRFPLPRIRERVGSDAIDVFNFHQGIALLNGLDYQPRPLFQSYVAFTPELQELDADYYSSPRAPKWVLFKLETIDERLPTMEQPRLFEALLRRYRPVLAERHELLLERRAEPLSPWRLTTEIEREVAFGQDIALPATATSARILTLDIRANALGQLAQVFFRAPELQLESLDEFGTQRRQRVVPGMMRTGVLIDPCIADGDSWTLFLVGARLPRLRALRVVVPQSWAWMYEPSIGLRLQSADGCAPPKDDALARELRAFAFERMPDRLDSPRPALRWPNGDHDWFFVYAPASMSWSLSPGRHSLTAFFGLTPDPRRMPCAQKAGFRAVLVDGGQQKPLLERWLDLSKPEERGVMPLQIEFEAANNCQLVLSTALPSSDAPKNAWCWWSEVKIDAQR